MTQRYIAPILLLAFLVQPAFGQKSDQEIREAIQTALSVRHSPPKAEWWKSLGPSAPRIIIAMYKDPDTTVTERIKLIEGLAWFDDPEAAAFLREKASQEKSSAFRGAAIRSLGVSGGAKEEEFIAGFLEHPDAQTRFEAAKTLRIINTDSANDRVERHLGQEKEPWIAEKLEGRLPKPSRTLAPITTSEDRLSPELKGTWRGFWITPQKSTKPGKKAKGMNSESAELKLEPWGAASLRGELVVTDSSNKTRKFVLENVRGKAKQFAGDLSKKSAETKSLMGFEASLSQHEDAWLLELRSRSTAGTLLVRKDAE